MEIIKNNPQFSGLTDEEVKSRIVKDGYNELQGSKARSFWAIMSGVVKEPMFLLLVACGTLYLVLGDMEEGLMLLGFVFVVMGIEFYQERKSEKALDALKDLDISGLCSASWTDASSSITTRAPVAARWFLSSSASSAECYRQTNTSGMSFSMPGKALYCWDAGPMPAGGSGMPAAMMKSERNMHSDRYSFSMMWNGKPMTGTLALNRGLNSARAWLTQYLFASRNGLWRNTPK